MSKRNTVSNNIVDAYKMFKETPWWNMPKKFISWIYYRSHPSYRNAWEWKSYAAVDPINNAVNSYLSKQLSKVEYKKVYMSAWRERQKSYKAADKEFNKARKDIKAAQKYFKLVDKGEK